MTSIEQPPGAYMHDTYFHMIVKIHKAFFQEKKSSFIADSNVTLSAVSNRPLTGPFNVGAAMG